MSAQTGGENTQRTGEKPAADPLPGRRRLGKPEVSSVGLGVQNMNRKYETTVPYRTEMINIIRARVRTVIFAARRSLGNWN